MPFNEQGEFIRADTSARRPAQQPTQAKSQANPQSVRTDNSDSGLSREDWIQIGQGLGALLLLAGLIWFVVVFREWILIGLGLWLISSLRGMFN